MVWPAVGHLPGCRYYVAWCGLLASHMHRAQACLQKLVQSGLLVGVWYEWLCLWAWVWVWAG